ncbi:hypothetical protein [Sphingobacterium sp.]|uniref:hypothetical protein n=1 Tax=Sphingobacterium sp. TaxID=341027 RepID=UPI00289B1249|nr:hypothetical protein [Sphingobacterium sp.]
MAGDLREFQNMIFEQGVQAHLDENDQLLFWTRYHETKEAFKFAKNNNLVESEHIFQKLLKEVESVNQSLDLMQWSQLIFYPKYSYFISRKGRDIDQVREILDKWAKNLKEILVNDSCLFLVFHHIQQQNNLYRHYFKNNFFEYSLSLSLPIIQSLMNAKLPLLEINDSFINLSQIQSKGPEYTVISELYLNQFLCNILADYYRSSLISMVEDYLSKIIDNILVYTPHSPIGIRLKDMLLFLTGRKNYIDQEYTPSQNLVLVYYFKLR